MIMSASSMEVLHMVKKSRDSSVVKNFLGKLSTGISRVQKNVFPKIVKISLAIVDMFHWEGFNFL